ncbi:MAG: hypothetical protein FJX56_02450 [Alphaproteobacteria bacterium]|nr:hypothetical protein [Alphaproteobacteria bacterium]
MAVAVGQTSAYPLDPSGSLRRLQPANDAVRVLPPRREADLPPREQEAPQPTAEGSTDPATRHGHRGDRGRGGAAIEGPFVRLNGFAGLAFGVPSTQFLTQALAQHAMPWPSGGQATETALAAYQATLARDIDVFAPILPVAVEA